MSQVVESDGMFSQLIGIMLIILGIVIAILVISSLDSTITQVNNSYDLSQNPTLAKASGYTSFDGTSATGFVGINGTREILITEHDSLIRQEGTIKSILIETSSDVVNPVNTGVYFQVYRNDTGGLYDLVGETGNYITEVQALGNNFEGEIVLDSSDWITGVQEGDFLGMKMTGTASTAKFIDNTAGENVGDSMYWFNSEQADTDVDFVGAGFSTGNYLRFAYKMDSPIGAAIGASGTSGVPQHYSYLQDDETPNEPDTTFIHKVGQSLGVPIQNLGHGSPINKSADGLARFDADVVDANPQFVIIGYGSPDYVNGVPLATFSSNMQSMISKAKTADIVPIILYGGPRDSFSNTEWLEFATYHDELLNLAITNDIPAVSISFLGQERVGGSPTPTPGNTWDFNPIYDSGDGVHMNEAAHTELASRITAEINNGFSGTINDSRHDLLNNAAIVFSLAAVLILILVLPLIRVVMRN